MARERSEYVEAQTMRILEHRGVDLSARGDADDGVGEGRRVPQEEVEALERIVGALSGRRRKEDEDAGDGEEMEE